MIEAYLSGTPVITSDRGSFLNTVVPDVTGYQCGCDYEYENALQKLDRLQLTGESLRNWAIERYDMNRLVPRYETLFAALLI